MSESAPDFKTVFGFRPPTEAELERALESLYLKVHEEGDPTGTQAFFGTEILRELGMDFIANMAAQYSEECDVPLEDAQIIVYATFISTIEMITTLRLVVDD